jgi:uncharacterized protein
VQTKAPNKRTPKVWIDLDNSPHVPFFMPIMDRLEKMGYGIEITARNCFQVCGLADLNKLSYKRIGKHYGKVRILKILGNLYRALQLLPIAAKAKPVIALSHGSRAMIVAARLLNIPTVVMIDYEFTQKIPFVHPALVITPQVVAANGISKDKTRVATYPGIKEDVYVPFFKPNGSLKRALGIQDDQIVVILRPPATEAHYHNPESEVLFAEVMDMLGAVENVKMFILPRNEIKQTAWVKQTWPELFAKGKAIIPKQVVDGLNLMWHSDLVISGGGTMNREAAALNVPVYSIFRGKIGAVDQYLSDKGRLVLLTSKGDVRSKIFIRKRSNSIENRKTDSDALNAVIKAINELIEDITI